MEIEDLSEKTSIALARLKDQKEKLGLPGLEVQTLSDFVREASKVSLSDKERLIILDEAMLLIEQLYAHLPFKQARYAINPVRRLTLLRHSRQEHSDLQFHTELLDIFTDLRDAHTFYGLPAPYKSKVAFLPFMVGRYFENEQPRFLVTQIMEGFDHLTFRREAEITHWNGMPIARAVERLAESSPGGNQDARLARGLGRLTLRMLTYSPLPDEEIVFVQYRPPVRNGEAPAEERTVAMPWSVGTGLGEPMFTDRDDSSVCAPLAQSAAVRRWLWCREQVIRERSTSQKYREISIPSQVPPPSGGTSPIEDLTKVSRLPEVFEFQHPEGSANGEVQSKWLRRGKGRPRCYSYLRIKRFDLDGAQGDFPDKFFEEFRRILVDVLKVKGPDGLILDVRGNPGGSITAAERILQLLTPKTIAPARFHFINTRLTQAVAANLKKKLPHEAPTLRAEVGADLENILNSVRDGELMTNGVPLTSPQTANDTGQVYQGPVVLIIDARAFSATEIFAGGFQDHGIGPILGADHNTGGGGASRWLDREVASHLKEVQSPEISFLAECLAPLPSEATMGVAIRRSSRTGPFAGATIEDVGVSTSLVVPTTRADLLGGDENLIARACEVLAKQTVYRLDILEAVMDDKQVNVTVRYQNLQRLEFFLDRNPQAARRVLRGANEKVFEVPRTDGFRALPKTVTVRGFVAAEKRIGKRDAWDLKASITAEIVRARRPKARKA